MGARAYSMATAKRVDVEEGEGLLRLDQLEARDLA